MFKLFSIGLGTALLTLASFSATTAAELGYVSSLAGEATAQRPGEEPRPLACGDPVFDDDTLHTGAESRVGVMLGDAVATHLAENTRVGLGRTEQASPAARLESGMVRVIDPRHGGAPAQLAVLDAEADVVGNDAEAYLFAEKVGPYAMLCEWDAPLPVTRGSEPTKTTEPGQCVIAKKREPLYTADAHEQRIPAAPEELCDIDVAWDSPANHLTPRDVASPGPGVLAGPGFAPLGFVGPDFTACEGGGPGCALGLPVVAQPGQGVNGPPVPGGAGQLP